MLLPLAERLGQTGLITEPRGRNRPEPAEKTFQVMDQEVIRNLKESIGMLPQDDLTPVRRFYQRVFDLAPETRALFTVDMEVQAGKLAEMLDWIAANVENPKELVPTLHSLGARHEAYGVTPDHYAPVGSALIWMFQETLGDRFTEEMEDAWLEAYAFLVGEMERGAREARAIQ